MSFNDNINAVTRIAVAFNIAIRYNDVCKQNWYFWHVKRNLSPSKTSSTTFYMKGVVFEIKTKLRLRDYETLFYQLFQQFFVRWESLLRDSLLLSEPVER